MADDFESFVRARMSALVRYGYVLSGNPHDAADLAQEALARLGERWPRVSATVPADRGCARPPPTSWCRPRCCRRSR